MALAGQHYGPDVFAGGFLDGFAQTVDERAVQRVATVGALHLQRHHIAIAGHTNHGATLYTLWSRDLHPVSGLFDILVAASLPRFTATCRARPGLTVGSTLDGGPDWADDARSLLVACEVNGGIVIALVR